MNIKYPLLIDGGLSNVLERQGCDLSHSLWSANMLATNPEAIVKGHLAYLEAGARCITTASYQATIAGFMAEGYDRQSAEALILNSVKLAKEAIRRFMAAGHGKDRPLIAASIGPYGAFLADGSEYRGKYGLTDEQLSAFHQPRLDILDNSPADLLACETIPDFQEARVLAKLLMNAGKPAWISFSCKDEAHLHDGTPIGECAAYFAGHPAVFALGVNCTAPEYVSGLLRTIRKSAGNKKIIAYPNSGQAFNAKTKTWLGTADPESFAAMAGEWLDLGADIIGGCCRIGPRQIRIMSRMIEAGKKKIKD